MIFSFAEKDKELIIDFEKKARAQGITLEDFEREKLDKRNQNLDLLLKEFEEILKKIESEQAQKLKTQKQIIEDAEKKTQDAIIFCHNLFCGMFKATGYKVLVSGLNMDNWYLFREIVKNGAAATLELEKEENANNKKSIVLEYEDFFEYLKDEVLQRHYSKIKSAAGKEKLDKAIYSILSNSEYIEHEPNSNDDSQLVGDDFLTSKSPRVKYQLKPLIYDENYDVAMANSLLLNGVNKLSATELKILRLAISQSKKGDTELYEYEIAARELAKFLNIDTKNLYRELDTMTDHIQEEFIKIKDAHTERFFKQSWVDNCDYENGILTIKIAKGLEPYILGLKSCFSKIKISEYIAFKSKHTIIIRELLEAKMGNEKPHADVVIELPITVEELKRVTNTAKKYQNIHQFKEHVLDVAIKEINDYYLGYHVTATPYKNGRSIEGYNFLIESQAHYDKYNRQDKSTISVKPGRKKLKPKEKEPDQQLSLKDIFEQEF